MGHHTENVERLEEDMAFYLSQLLDVPSAWIGELSHGYKLNQGSTVFLHRVKHVTRDIYIEELPNPMGDHRNFRITIGSQNSRSYLRHGHVIQFDIGKGRRKAQKIASLFEVKYKESLKSLRRLE